jgi:hypothetical protein
MTFSTVTGTLKIAAAAASLIICTQSFAQTDTKASSLAMTNATTSTVAMNAAPLSLNKHLYRKINYCPGSCISSLDCRQCAGYPVCHFVQASNVGVCSDR